MSVVVRTFHFSNCEKGGRGGTYVRLDYNIVPRRATYRSSVAMYCSVFVIFFTQKMPNFFPFVLVLCSHATCICNKYVENGYTEPFEMASKYTRFFGR